MELLCNADMQECDGVVCVYDPPVPMIAQLDDKCLVESDDGLSDMPELQKNTSLIQKEDVQQLISVPDMKIQVSNSLRHDARTHMFIQNARFMIPEKVILRESKWKGFAASVNRTQKLIGSPKRLAITDGISSGQCSPETFKELPPFTFEGGSRYSR